jgi:hypothetical protein
MNTKYKITTTTPRLVVVTTILFVSGFVVATASLASFFSYAQAQELQDRDQRLLNVQLEYDDDEEEELDNPFPWRRL